MVFTKKQGTAHSLKNNFSPSTYTVILLNLRQTLTQLLQVCNNCVIRLLAELNYYVT